MKRQQQEKSIHNLEDKIKIIKKTSSGYFIFANFMYQQKQAKQANQPSQPPKNQRNDAHCWLDEENRVQE